MFESGEPALLVDSKGREFLLKLETGRNFQFHRGTVAHDSLIGAEDGTWVESSGGERMLLIRPRLADFTLRMKRGAQVVYPKDVGPILVYGDIAPGHTVVEAGTGSGALTIWLTRAVGPSGRVVSVERRDDHAKHAEKTINRWFGEIPGNLELVRGDVAEVVAGAAADRVVLDVPEPWHTVETVAAAGGTGLIMSIYLPTVPQVEKTVQTARDTGRFDRPQIQEFMARSWNVDGRSVRPEHSMVGHTGFLIFLRKIADEPLDERSDN